MGSVRLDAAIKEKVRRVARLKGLSLSQVHRMALERFCEQELAAAAGRRSRYSDVIGVGEGSPELSSRAGEVFDEIVDGKRSEGAD